MTSKSAKRASRKKTPDARPPKADAKNPQKKHRLVILDSHAILHRAYHALPDFSSSKGEPTGALYGLLLMLLKIVDDLKPDYIVAARDLPGPTHRHKKFEAYKAHRMKADDALIVQLERAPEVFESFGIPVYAKPGYEADDVIGAIVQQVKDRDDVETIIATGDMDTLQLVGESVRVFTLRKGLSDTVLYDPERVRERYGFGPEHIVDYKALRGDPSDNIPGVRGIGEKTATELIQAFGSMEAIYKALDKDPASFERAGIKARIIQLLTEQKEQAEFSKELATIHAGVPINFSIPHEDWDMVRHAMTIDALCDRYDFRALKERLRGTLHAITEIDAHDAPPQDVDPARFEETALALWLLHSDATTPTLADILTYAQTEHFDEAHRTIFEELGRTGRLREVYEQIEQPLLAVVATMNASGISVDTAHLKQLAKEYSTELAAIAERIYGYAGHEFNVNSPKQLGGVLYDELGLSLGGKQKKTATGARTTREDELAKMAELHPIIGDVLEYREIQKLLGTYIEKIPALVGRDGRLRARFLQTGTVTGRMGCEDPNLQNIPIKTERGRRIREAFTAEAGKVLVAIDYSQIELRIAAGLSGDTRLVQIFQSGEDVHAATAAQVFGVDADRVDREMRRRAKVINFGILYGMGVNALRANLAEGAPEGQTVSRDEAARFLEQYFKNFSGLAQYIERVKAETARLGYTETLFGRRRYFPGIKSALPNLRAQAERMAVNAPIQGTQADIIKRAMVEADELIKKNRWEKKARLLLQVHDELVYEVNEKEAEDIARAIRDVMESVVDPKDLSGVPIRAEISIGETWGSVQKIKRT